MDVVNEFIFQAAASPWLLLVMFAVALIDGFFPPVPSETVLVAAAAIAASSGNIPMIALLCTVAAVGAWAGDNIAYGIGRSVGVTRFAWMRGPRMSAVVERASHALAHRAAPLILGARYIPIGRVAVNMSAGALGYPWKRFLPISAIASLTWAVYSALIGVVAGQWLKDQPLWSAVIGVVVAVAIGIVVDRVSVMRRKAQERREAAKNATSGPVPTEDGITRSEVVSSASGEVPLLR